MFENYTRGLIKRLNEVTKFSTFVGDIIRKTNELFDQSLDGYFTNSLEGDFSDHVIKNWVLTDTEELYQAISIRTIIDENDKEFPQFVMKIQLTASETITNGDEDVPDENNTVSTLVTIYPGGKCYSGADVSNIYNQQDMHRAGHPAAIEIGNFDKSIQPLEQEINLSDPEDFLLKSNWDRKALRKWFESVLESLDRIYNTHLLLDDDYDYDTDIILNRNDDWE
jgi:hypothetical protein